MAASPSSAHRQRVLYANPRGSTSYGEDFANSIHLAYPGYDDDLISGVDAVIARGFIDTRHLFVTGGSGGGVLTADQTPYFHRHWFKGFPWESQADYRTPITETEQYYQALRLRGVPTAMVRVPEASHGLSGRPSQFIAKIDNIPAWFERYRLPLTE